MTPPRERAPSGTHPAVANVAASSTDRPRSLAACGVVPWRADWLEAQRITGVTQEEIGVAFGCSHQRVSVIIGNRGPTQAHMDMLVAGGGRTLEFARVYQGLRLSRIDQRSPDRQRTEEWLRANFEIAIQEALRAQRRQA